MYPYITTDFIGTCFEGFFYGIYSGIFALYLQCPSKKSRTATILFYAVCLLYVLSTITFVGDLVSCILEINIQSDSMLRLLLLIQITLSGCCDFIAQCIIIYRCWIVWGQNIGVVIIPSLLAITFLATWLATNGAPILVHGQYFITSWMFQMTLTSFGLSMTVHALVTSLIVFRILMVFLGNKPTSVERTLGSTGGTTLRHIIFVIIESGMMLFAIQLVRVELGNLPSVPNGYLTFSVGMNEMFNGIAPTLILVRVSMRLSFEDKDSFKEAVESLCFNNPPSNPTTMGSSRSLPSQERSEDICFNNPSNDPNTLGRMGSSSSIPPQERSGDT